MTASSTSTPEASRPARIPVKTSPLPAVAIAVITGWIQIDYTIREGNYSSSTFQNQVYSVFCSKSTGYFNAVGLDLPGTPANQAGHFSRMGC